MKPNTNICGVPAPEGIVWACEPHAYASVDSVQISHQAPQWVSRCSCVGHLVFLCFSCWILISLTGVVAAVAIPDAKRKIYAEITVKFCSVSADRVSESWGPQATKTLVESNWLVIMAATPRAPKQWCLTKTETITSFESWRQNLVYALSLDTQFAPFLVDGATWLKKTKANLLRGFTDDGSSANPRRTAQQKVNMLELMLGQIANYCPVISRNTIVKNSTSVDCIWASIRLHYGFQVTEAHFIDFTDIHLENGERREELFSKVNGLHGGQSPSKWQSNSPRGACNRRRRNVPFPGEFCRTDLATVN